MLHVRFILNTFVSGPQAWFFVADDRGYFAAEGLEVTFVPGDTLANAVPKVASGAFDLGYGDLNAVITLAAEAPGAAPPAVFIMHNASPYTIAVAAEGPVRTPGDLAGRHLLSHADDAAWKMFDTFAAAANVDPATVSVTPDGRHHRELLPLILAGTTDGLFGFVNTLASAAIEAGLDPTAFRHFEWRTIVPDLCGAAVIASPAFIAAHPDAVRGFVRAVNRALADVVADPEAAIGAVRRRDPGIDVKANLARLTGTLALEMAHPDGATYGIGAVDPARLDRAIDLVARVKGLTRRPATSAIFDARFLPAADDRVRTLARRR
ncbi:ABC transporter substrate-binding protein [Phreatobacter cathodiphilus]|uniref:ABC transporter substrate-binding protein n=1 Tax=Phreatobacter cathodiphilus TaxID=1868589 RepID=A0A2S0NAF5_9HYPH|nr:ABC transporter substrate-binding protein [Phreatobacter cathodiphilus]AVO45154.1 ABC transporter substrate-binding protein [Phreatobacter cathodiphilus]